MEFERLIPIHKYTNTPQSSRRPLKPNNYTFRQLLKMPNRRHHSLAPPRTNTLLNNSPLLKLLIRDPRRGDSQLPLRFVPAYKLFGEDQFGNVLDYGLEGLVLLPHGGSVRG
jgi:hypothetical protein